MAELLKWRMFLGPSWVVPKKDVYLKKMPMMRGHNLVANISNDDMAFPGCQ